MLRNKTMRKSAPAPHFPSDIPLISLGLNIHKTLLYMKEKRQSGSTRGRGRAAQTARADVCLALFDYRANGETQYASDVRQT